MPSIPPQYHRIHRVVVTAVVAPHTMSLSCWKKLAFIYQAKVKKNDSHYHCIWGKFEPPTLRAVRFRYAINRVTPRRKLKQSRPSAAESSTSGNIEARELNNSQVRKNVEAKPVRFQQQQLDDETHALQLELGSMLDAVQETESKMVEMSALNHLMSTHVLQQANRLSICMSRQLRQQRT